MSEKGNLEGRDFYFYVFLQDPADLFLEAAMGAVSIQETLKTEKKCVNSVNFCVIFCAKVDGRAIFKNK